VQKLKLLWICTGAPSHERFDLPGRFPDFNVCMADGLGGVREAADLEPADCIVAHGPIADVDRVDYLDALHHIHANVPVIFWDAEMSAAEAVRLVRAGAFHCIGHRDGLDDLHEALDRAVEQKHRERNATDEPWRKLLVGKGRAMDSVAEIIRMVGARRCTVLITGESGTGKEMAARALHMASPRANHPMVAINCAGLPEHLLEAELFGHVKGAFTGATNARAGHFEQANKGTIFLDEIGDMPLDLQPKLLRVLQSREIQRLGSSETIKIDVRVVAATNANLAQKIRDGKFREDLYYRLNVVPLQMPPLRKRSEDIPALVHHFIAKVCQIEGIPMKSLGPDVLSRLQACPWPGNVRQLENAVEMAVAMNGDAEILQARHFGLPNPVSAKLIAFDTLPRPNALEEAVDFETAVTRFERSMIDRALRKSGGNKTAAAELLGLKRTTLIMKLRQLENTPEACAV
jgi:DNA-binding NtrC family response regulator